MILTDTADKKQNSDKTSSPDGIVVIDRNLRFVVFNVAVQQITGFKEADVLHKQCSSLFPGWDHDYTYFRSVVTEGKSYNEVPLSIYKSDGSQTRVVCSITPFDGTKNNHNFALLAIHEPETQLRLQDTLAQQTHQLLAERNKLTAIFNSRLEGTFTTDQNCIITTFNRSAEKITGYAYDEAIGKRCWEIMDSHYCRTQCTQHKPNKAYWSKPEPRIKEIFITRKDGKRIPVRTSSAPLMDPDGESIGSVESFQDMSELDNLSAHLENRFQIPHIIGRSEAMRRIYQLIDNVSQSNSTVLITGESGTGKELVARSIHLHSYRRTGPFIALNCSAFVENLLESELFGHERGAFTSAIQSKRGRFELAQDGTLFLDEIGDISQSIQVKLLRVLESRRFEHVGGNKPIEVNFRLITATNRNRSDEVARGAFREDFFYRINVINIHLPPLRERMEDLPLLVQHLIEKNSERFGKHIRTLSPATFGFLKAYQWPGNIRELENVIEHAFVMCSTELIEPEHLPEKLWTVKSGYSDATGTSITPIQQAEKVLIKSLLEQFNGHRGKTAVALDIDKSTLWRKMKKFQML